MFSKVKTFVVDHVRAALVAVAVALVAAATTGIPQQAAEFAFETSQEVTEVVMGQRVAAAVGTVGDAVVGVMDWAGPADALATSTPAVELSEIVDFSGTATNIATFVGGAIVALAGLMLAIGITWSLLRRAGARRA